MQSYLREFDRVSDILKNQTSAQAGKEPNTHGKNRKGKNHANGTFKDRFCTYPGN